jgi:hypothetical protein
MYGTSLCLPHYHFMNEIQFDINGDLCNSRKGDMNQIQNFTYTVNHFEKDNALTSCQGTLADNSKDECIITTAEKCTQSRVFDNRGQSLP